MHTNGGDDRNRAVGTGIGAARKFSMKTTLLNWRRAWRTGVAVAALALASCVTDDQVKQIVTESNLASLSAQLDFGGVNAAGPGAAGNWQDASKKIEAVIAANPDQVSMNAALRVRQAVMLLQNGQYNLATAAFGEASLDNLHTARDRAFKTLAKELVWWYQIAGNSESIDFPTATAAQAKIDGVVKTLTADPQQAKLNEGIRDLLVAMRAFIGVKMATDVYGVDQARTYLQDAINGFAASLPVGETAAWTKLETAPNTWPPAGLSLDVAVSGTNRRHFTALSLIDAAKKAMAANAITGVQVSDVYFQTRLGP